MQTENFICELCNRRVPLSNRTIHLLRCEQRVSPISSSSSNVDALNADNVDDASKDNKWTCKFCTYYNNNFSEYCEVCNNKQSIQNQSCENTNDEHTEGEIAATNNWRCIYCTFDNCSNEINCLICNRPPVNTNILLSPNEEFYETLDLNRSMPTFGTTILLGAGIGASVAWLNNRNVRSGASFGASLGVISGLLIEEFLNERDRNALSEGSSRIEMFNSLDTDVGSSSPNHQRYYSRRVNSDIGVFEDLLSQHLQLGNPTEGESLDQQQQQQQHLSEDIINSLPVRNFNRSSSKHEKEACPICLNNYTIGCEIKTLPCLHNYHSTCIDNWLKQSNNCPICKFKIS